MTLTRNNNIDLIKLYACICVVALHTISKDLSSITTVIYYLSGVAVPLFFMSSGYFLLNRGEISIKYSIVLRQCFVKPSDNFSLFLLFICAILYPMKYCKGVHYEADLKTKRAERPWHLCISLRTVRGFRGYPLGRHKASLA